jgi:phage terminase large subunit GpA-like protein
MLSINIISDRLVALGNHEHDGSARAAILSRLDNLLPQDAISTHDWAVANRKLRGPTGEVIDFNPDLTPYLKGIQDAADDPRVRVVAIKGNTRSGKTVLFENTALRGWSIGPAGNVLWFMQDEDSINDYIDERGEDMLVLHERVNEKIDWSDRRNSRKRKKIGRSLVLYRPATMRSTRGKAAPLIIADEIDAYVKKVRDAIMGLVQNRQREYGNAATALLGSHPDAGPDGGIDSVLNESLLHLWWACCLDCGKSASPAVEAETRWAWNVGDLLKASEEMERRALLDMIQREARLVCPHCKSAYDNDRRLTLMRAGTWLQPHQTLENGVITGDAEVRDVMGFVIHAFMAPFINLGKTARDWSAAKLAADASGNDINLRERTVKDLGETYMGTKAEEMTEGWKVVKSRLDAPYELKTVPEGVRFLTQFVDVQGDRFEVRVIGWSLSLESWLVDAYAIKQWPAFGKHGAFDNIDPANRLTDWDIIEEACLMARYPLVRNPDLFMPIAKTVVNNAGSPGVTNNGRVWLANLLARTEGRLIESYRVQLMQGAAAKKAKLLYGKAEPILFDDKKKPLKVQIYERYPVVHEIKKIIMRRMKIGEPGPGAMHMPFRLSARYARELVSERLINEEWIKSGANETWDGWVACECARAWLAPDRPGLWDVTPDWAEPRAINDTIDTDPRNPLSIFDRLRQVNDDIT